MNFLNPLDWFNLDCPPKPWPVGEKVAHIEPSLIEPITVNLYNGDDNCDLRPGTLKGNEKHPAYPHPIPMMNL